MKKLLAKFKIPTLLGISIIIIGIIAGVILTLKEQIFISSASPDVTAQNITLSNISDTSVSISWQTATPVISFVTYGQANPNEQTVLSDKDSSESTRPKARTIHYVTIKNLLPKTTYQYKVLTGKLSSTVAKFTTATPINQQIAFKPVIGSVLEGAKALQDGIVYLSISDAATLSAQIKSGNFLISLSQIRTADLSDSFSLRDDLIGKLVIIADKGKTTNALFRLKDVKQPLPALKLGQDIDLTIQAAPTTASPSAQELIIYDLNADGKINAADNAVILQNFGKKGKETKGDLNKDGVVDQKDLDLMAKQINQ